jgi:putative flippase GtrA
MRCMNREFVRFVCVGLVNTAAGYLLYLMLLPFLSYTMSFALVYAAGIFISYALNSRFVYRQPLALKKALRFPVVYAVQYALSALTLWASVEFLAVDPRIAPLFAIALTVPVVYLLGRRIIRGGPVQDPGSAAPSEGQTRGKTFKTAGGRFLINGSLCLAGTVLAVLLVEAALRFTGYAFLLGRDYRAPRYYFAADRENGYDIQPNQGATLFDFKESSHWIWSNELGCFDRPYRGEEPFILLLGDSTAWGYKPLEELWGSVVESQTSTRVLKCAVPGYGTKHEVLKGRKVIAQLGRPPSLIIVGHCVNDHLDDYLHPYRTVVDGHVLQSRSFADVKSGEVLEKSEAQLRMELQHWDQYGVPYKPPYPFLTRLKRFLNEHSVVYRIVQPVLEKMLRQSPLFASLGAVLLTSPESSREEHRNLFYSPGSYPWLDRAWNLHFQNLKDLHRLADESGAALLIVLLPNREQVYEPARAKELLANHERLRAFLQQEKISFVDLLVPFQQVASRASGKGDQEGSLYWRLDSHAGLLGDRLAGLHVARRLIEESFIDVPDRQDRLMRIDDAIAGCCGKSP